MISSMTGYGKSIAEAGGRKMVVEIRSLNSRYMDLNLRLPHFFKEKEIELRNLITTGVERGKVDFTVSVENAAAQAGQEINKELVKKYYNDLREISSELKAKEDLLHMVMRIPNVLSTEEQDLDPEVWQAVLKASEEAIEQLNEFRKKEGAELEKDLRLRVNNILYNLEEIALLEPQRVTRQRERLKEQLDEYIGADKVDENRFEEEILYYLEKIDITEEKVRLKSHCSFLLHVLDEKESSKGKKLGFISQEIGREINTIGSKANDAAIQKLVVQMKDDLEKIKEQLMNVL